VITLEKMGDQASPFAPELISALESDPDVVVRRWAIRTLEHAARSRHLLKHEGNGESSRMKEVALRIVDEDPIVRQWVLLTLARFGKDANSSPEVLKAITQALSAEEPLQVRCIAVGAAAHFNETKEIAKSHSNCIAEALSSEDQELRRTGALALALLGPGAFPGGEAQAAEQVLRTLKDPDIIVRRGAARALRQFHEMSAKDVEQAASYLNDPDIAVRICAICALGQLRKGAESHAEEVSEMLAVWSQGSKECHPELYYYASWALPRMGNQGYILHHDYLKAQEAHKIQESNKDNPIGKCYRSIGEVLWNFEYSTYQKVKEYCPCLPQRTRRQEYHLLSPTKATSAFAGATMRRFKG